MDGGGDECFGVTDDLACGDAVFFGDGGFTGCADMLAQEDGKLFWGRAGLDLTIMGELFIIRRMYSAWESEFSFGLDVVSPAKSVLTL